MTRKTGQQEPDTEETAAAPPELNSGIEEFDISETDQHSAASLSGRVYAFLQRVEIEDTSPVYYLSKYDNFGSGEQKSFVAKFEDCEPPDEALIGSKYGPGRYILTCQIPPSRNRKNPVVRIYRFRVSTAFARREEPAHLAAIPAAIPAAAPGVGMPEMFAMFERFVSLLLPLFNRPRDENVLGILNQNYSTVNELMKKQMQDNLKLLTDYQRNIASITEEGEAEEVDTTDDRAETPSIIEQFGPLIQQWIPLLLGGGPKAAAAGALVNTVPQVQEVLKDKMQLRKIIAFLDQSQGPNKTDKILAALKIQRSGKRPVQVQQVPQRKKVPAKAGG